MTTDTRYGIQTGSLMVTTGGSRVDHGSMPERKTRPTLMVVTDEIAAKLKEAAARDGRPYEVLAEVIGTSKTTVNNILNGKVRTSPWVKPLCELLGVDCGQGVDLDEDQIAVLDALELARSHGLGAEFVKLAQRLSQQLVNPALPLPPPPSGEVQPQTRALPAPPISRGSK